MPEEIDLPRVEVLIDTGVFVAAADTDEPRHRDCAAILDTNWGRIGTTGAVVAEAAWLIEARLGPAAETKFLTMAATGTLTVVDLTRADYQRCIELIGTYHDLRLGIVDASLVTIAERLGLRTLATLNTRDFHVVRPSHTKAFELIPTPTS